MRFVAILFCLRLAQAATLESVPLPSSIQLTLHPSGIASTPDFSLTCSGYSFLGGFGLIPLTAFPTGQPARANVTFIGASPNCLVRGLDPLPGRQNLPTAENLPRYSRALFQNVWPGIDAEISVSAPRIRLTFSLASPDLVSSLQIRLPQEHFENVSYTDIRQWGYRVQASVRAIERSAVGPRSVSVAVDNTRPAPFLLPAGLSNPVDIILEADFSPDSSLVSASLVTPSGERFEAHGAIVRKYDQNGKLVFETLLETTAPSIVSSLTLGPDETLYAFGSFDNSYFFFLYPQLTRISVHRLDNRTGSVRFSRYIGESWHNSGGFLAFQPSGNLLLAARSNSALFPRIGPIPSNPCQPSPPSGFSNGTFCTYLVTLSPAGELLSSRPLPATTSAVAAGRDRIVHILHPDRIETLNAAFAPRVGIPLPAGLSPHSFAADAADGLWVSAQSQSVKQLLHFPAGAATPRIVAGIDFLADLVPLAEGGIIATSRPSEIHPSTSRYTAGALMPAPCPQGSPEFAVIDSSGSIRYGTFLPPSISPPSVSRPAIWRNGKLSWERYTLNLDAPPTVAIVCLTDPAGNYIGDVAAGSKLELAVRGVQDESPWQPGAQPATDVRGWSVRFDGIPAAILGLDQDKVTVVVPGSLSNGPIPREVVMSFWYRGRQEDYWNVRLVAARSEK
jgi:hypothetical protein